MWIGGGSIGDLNPYFDSPSLNILDQVLAKREFSKHPYLWLLRLLVCLYIFKRLLISFYEICGSSVCQSDFIYPRDCSLVFMKFWIKLGHHKGTKVTEPDFWKKNLGGHKLGKSPILGAFLMFFVHISSSIHFTHIISSTLSNSQ